MLLNVVRSGRAQVASRRWCIWVPQIARRKIYANMKLRWFLSATTKN